jgi:hypothetical protein
MDCNTQVQDSYVAQFTKYSVAMQTYLCNIRQELLKTKDSTCSQCIHGDTIGCMHGREQILTILVSSCTFRTCVIYRSLTKQDIS